MHTSSDSRHRIFLVGYPRGYRLELADAFEAQGYSVMTFEDARLAADALGNTLPDAALIQWNTAGPLSTLEFIERFGGLLPILLLTRHNVLIDLVQSLRAGAADYIRLPCYFPEILARVERAQSTTPTRERISLGCVSLDVGARVVRIDGETIQLTAREARLLAALLRCPERPVSRAALLRAAGISGAKPTILESYAKQLRQKHSLLRRCLRTVYGQGYAFFPAQEEING